MPPDSTGGTHCGELWVMQATTLVGRFMILLDATVVVVANPCLMSALNTAYDTVIWVTSAYLLAFAVGNAAMAALMTLADQGRDAGGQRRKLLPEFLREPFSEATSQAMWLPAVAALFGITAARFMVAITASIPGIPVPTGPGDTTADSTATETDLV